MDFASPSNFKWIWLAVAVLAGFWILERRKRSMLKRYGDLKLIDQMSSSLDAGKRRWKHSFAAFAVFLIALCLAEPQLPGKSVFVKKTGLDIVIAIDVSNSMLAEDIRPNRLEKAKLELQDFVEKAKGDRIGVVAFAGQAYIQVPLTLDRSAVKLFIKTLHPDLIPVQGTMIGEAIRAATSMFDPDSKDDKVLVLLTDGEDQGSDPVGAARDAVKKGVRIYAIGIGTAKGEVIPLRQGGGRGVQFKKDLRGQTVVSKLDEETLQRLTRESDGVYYRSQKGNLETDRIHSDIRNLGKKETGTGWVVEHDPLYAYPLLAAILLLLSELLISERRKQS